MTNDRNGPPDHLTFSQRYSYEPIPEPMKLEQISSGTKARNLEYGSRELLNLRPSKGIKRFRDNEKRLIERIIGKYKKISESKVSTDYDDVMVSFEKSCLSSRFNTFLDMLEAIINERRIDVNFTKKIRGRFERG